MKPIATRVLLALLLCLTLTSCGLQATHRYTCEGQELVVDVSADVVEYGGETYTYVLEQDSWTITYPSGDYDQETVRDDGNRVASSSWTYDSTPESHGYLSAETLLSYIRKAEGSGPFYLRPVWWAGLVVFGLGTLTMLWPDWLRLQRRFARIAGRVVGALAAFGGLGLMLS